MGGVERMSLHKKIAWIMARGEKNTKKLKAVAHFCRTGRLRLVNEHKERSSKARSFKTFSNLCSGVWIKAKGDEETLEGLKKRSYLIWGFKYYSVNSIDYGLERENIQRKKTVLVVVGIWSWDDGDSPKSEWGWILKTEEIQLAGSSNCILVARDRKAPRMVFELASKIDDSISY